MDVEQVKVQARQLKEIIEYELHKFREATGYTPRVDIETKVKYTNEKNFVRQTVTITLTIE
jgi:hypothetical protein